MAPAHGKVGAVNDEVERVVAVHYKEEAVDAHDAVELVHDLPHDEVEACHDAVEVAVVAAQDTIEVTVVAGWLPMTL